MIGPRRARVRPRAGSLWLVALACACGAPREEEPSSPASDRAPASVAPSPAATGASAASAPASAATPDPAPAPGFRAIPLGHTPTSIAFRIDVGAGTPLRDLGPEGDPLAFCVPQGRPLRVEVVEAAASGESVAPEAIAGGVEIRPLGILRRWPTAIVRFSPEFFAAAVAPDADATRGPFAARLAIVWDEPVALGSGAFADEISGDSPWNAIARRFVANPAGLRHFALADPPPPSEYAPSPPPPTVPPVGAPPNSTPWLRVRATGDGLFRLDAAALRASPGWAPDDVPQLLYRGRPVATIERDGQIFFRNAANPSPYSTERVRFVRPLRSVVAGDPMTPANFIEADPALAGVEAIETTATLLTATRAIENELLLDEGPFREIRAMAWAETPLDEAAPRVARVESVGAPDPRGAPARATFRFAVVVDPARDRAEPLDGLAVEIAGEDGVARSFPIPDATRAEVEFEIPAEALAAAFADGAADFAVRLAGPLPPSLFEASFVSARIDYVGTPRARPEGIELRPLDAATTETASARWIPLDGVERDRVADWLAVEVVPGPDGTESMRALAFEARGDRVGVRVPVRPAGDPLAGSTRAFVYDLKAARVADRIEPVRPDDLLREDRGAELLIVAHADFMEAIEPLAAFHRARGTSVRVADVQSVYDAFSHGELDPRALRDLLAHALRNWRGGAPRVALLVGDCTSDYRDFARTGVPNFVPSFAAGEAGARFASDEWFGLVAGDDPLPDVVVSRLSVSSPEDLGVVVGNAIRRAGATRFGPERARVALASDKSPAFEEAVESFAREFVPPAAEPRRLYLREFDYVDNYYAPDEARRAVKEAEGRWMKISDAAAAEMLDVFRDGAAVLTYLGHGSPNVWATERVWFGGGSPNSDNLRLAGFGKMPFVVNFTCNSGAIDYPMPPWNTNIVEDMMRIPDGGAIGSLAPSGPGRTPVQQAFGRQIFRAIFDDGLRRIGEIVALAKARFAARGAPGGVLEHFTREYVLSYVLLGDPSLELNLAPRFEEFAAPRLPFAPGSTLDFAASAGGLASGKAVVELADATGRRLGEEAAPIDFAGGAIPVRVAIPEDAKPGPARVRVYAWNEAEGREYAGAAWISVADPGPREGATAPVPTAPPGAPADLRIVAESIRVSPESPSEGGTIHVAFVVANAGGSPSGPATVGLYEGDPAAGGALAYNHDLFEDGLPNFVEIPPLAPGERAERSLQWDPSFNAGENEFWVAFAGGADPRAVRGTVRVRSKAKLGYRNVRREASEADLLAGRVRLHAEIVNDGETDARNVAVAFFKGKTPTPPNLVHETLIEVVPASSVVPVDYEWRFTGLRDLVDDAGAGGFMIQVWIKGSRTRTSSETVE